LNLESRLQNHKEHLEKSAMSAKDVDSKAESESLISQHSDNEQDKSCFTQMRLERRAEGLQEDPMEQALFLPHYDPAAAPDQ
jgi:hypothetical protein